MRVTWASQSDITLLHLWLTDRISLGFFRFLPQLLLCILKAALYSQSCVGKQSLLFQSHFGIIVHCSVAKSCPTLCNSWTAAHQASLSFTISRVFLSSWISDAIQLSHPLSSPSPSAFSLSQHQGLFQRVGSSHQVAKVLELQSQHQSFQWIFRVDFL